MLYHPVAHLMLFTNTYGCKCLDPPSWLNFSISQGSLKISQFQPE